MSARNVLLLMTLAAFTFGLFAIFFFTNETTEEKTKESTPQKIVAVDLR